MINCLFYGLTDDQPINVGLISADEWLRVEERPLKRWNDVGHVCISCTSLCPRIHLRTRTLACTHVCTQS